MAIKPIVVGTDGSEPSLRAMDWATREAGLRDVPLRIVSVCAIEPRANWVIPPGSGCVIRGVSPTVRQMRRSRQVRTKVRGQP